MSDFITLSCPSCGAKLEITQDINRFACSHCGMEHIVKRSGGIVSLSPVVEAINQVKSGVDKTTAELAMVRLPKEIENLKKQKIDLLVKNPRPSSSNPGCFAKIMLILCTLSLVFGLPRVFITNILAPNDLYVGIFLTIIGIVGIIIGIVLIRRETPKQTEIWEKTTGEAIELLNKQIVSKQSELERNRKLVSQ